MDKDKILLNLFLEREELKNKISEVKKELNEVRIHHYTIGAPFNENMLKFNNKQLHYLRKNLDSIEYSLSILKEENSGENE